MRLSTLYLLVKKLFTLMDIGIHHKAPPSPKCVRPRYEPTFQWPSQQRLRHGVVLNENVKDEIRDIRGDGAHGAVGIKIVKTEMDNLRRYV